MALRAFVSDRAALPRTAPNIDAARGPPATNGPALLGVLPIPAPDTGMHYAPSTCNSAQSKHSMCSAIIIDDYSAQSFLRHCLLAQLK